LSAENSRRDAVTHQEAVETLATERYLLEDMSAADRDAFEEHFFACQLCADDLRVAGAMMKGARAGFAGGIAAGRVVPMTPPAARKRAVWYRSAVLPWAAAAALALVTTYQSFWVVPSLRQGASPVAIVPVTLHPASRGAEAVVPLRAGADPVSLAVEINEPVDGGELAYELRTAAGHAIVSGQAAAPAPGAPLFLLIPSRMLAESTHYTLLVRDRGPSGRPLGEYRFTVSAQ
jgi:hypothetical protein